MEKIKDNILR